MPETIVRTRFIITADGAAVLERDVNTNLRNAAALAAVFGTQATKAAQQAKKSFDEVKESSKGLLATLIAAKNTVTGFFAVSGIGSAISAFASFRGEMNRVQAATSATGADFDRLQEQAIQLGRNTRFSALEAAKAQRELATRNLSTNEVLEATPKLLQFAAVSNVEFAEAADRALNVLNQFAPGIENLDHVLDVLTATGVSSAGELIDISEAFKNVGSTSHIAGISLESTAAAIAFLSQQGIRGSEAGTKLKNVIAGLVAPSGEARKILEDFLGKDFESKIGFGSGKLREFSEIIKVLGDAGITTTDIFEIFGLRGAVGAAGLIGSEAGLKNFEEVLARISGEMKKVAKITEKDFFGTAVRLAASAGSIIISLGVLLEPALIRVGEGIAAVVRGFGDLIDRFRRSEFFQALLERFESLGRAIDTIIVPGLIESSIIIEDQAIALAKEFGKGIKTIFSDVLEGLRTLDQSLGGQIPILSPLVQMFDALGLAFNEPRKFAAQLRVGLDALLLSMNLLLQGVVTVAVRIGSALANVLAFAADFAANLPHNFDVALNRMKSGTLVVLRTIASGLELLRVGIESFSRTTLAHALFPGAPFKEFVDQLAAAKSGIGNLLAGLGPAKAETKGFALDSTALGNALRDAGNELLGLNAASNALGIGSERLREQLNRHVAALRNVKEEARGAKDESLGLTQIPTPPPRAITPRFDFEIIRPDPARLADDVADVTATLERIAKEKIAKVKLPEIKLQVPHDIFTAAFGQIQDPQTQRLVQQTNQFATFLGQQRQLARDFRTAETAERAAFDASEAARNSDNQDLILAAQKKHSQALQAVEQSKRAAILKSTGSLFGALAQLSAGGNDKLFKLTKTFAIADATIGAFAGANAALRSGIPPPGNIIMAAAVLAQGLANVRQIKAIQPGGGGGGGAPGGVGIGGVPPVIGPGGPPIADIPPTTTPVAVAGETRPQRSIELVIEGNVFGDEVFVRERMAPILREALGDNADLGVKS